MQELNWNDLRYVLAVARQGSLAPAARILRVNETTVSRRIARAEALLGSQLFYRGEGRLLPTEAGLAVIGRAERIETEVELLREAASGANATAAGSVRLTAIPILINRLLLPAMKEFCASHPHLRVELVAEPRNLSLTKRDADIALRLACPNREQRLIARRVAQIEYVVFGPSAAREAPLPWITYDDGMLDLPHAAWIAQAAKAEGDVPRITVNDSELALHAIKAGLGKSLLPRTIAEREEGLSPLDGGRTVLERELWLLVHPELRHLARIRATIAWLEEVIGHRM